MFQIEAISTVLSLLLAFSYHYAKKIEKKWDYINNLKHMSGIAKPMIKKLPISSAVLQKRPNN